MIKTTKVEIFGFGRSTGHRDNWLELSFQVQRMLNHMWAYWAAHHFTNASADKLRQHLDEYAKWKDARQGDKPTWPVQVCDKHLANKIYHSASTSFPTINARTRVLLQNKWQSSLSSRKSAKGSLKGWVAILFHHEAMPSFTSHQPILFDKDNGKLKRDGDKFVLELRIERLPDTGKSVVEHCELMLNRRKASGIRQIIERIMAGEYTMKGSSICFSRGKWFANISYEMPARSNVHAVPGRALQLIPGKRSPWLLRSTSESGKTDAWRFGGRGGFIALQRRNLIRERRQRSEHYRWAGSNQKGHGRGRADAVWTKLSSRWRDLVKRYNNEITRRLVDMAKQRGVERITYHQPSDQQRDKTYLSREGRPVDCPMTWDWFQVGTLLAAKCEEAGIEFKSVKTSNDVPRVRRGNGSKQEKRVGKKAANMS